jgi:hypothetical protein
MDYLKLTSEKFAEVRSMVMVASKDASAALPLG